MSERQCRRLLRAGSGAPSKHLVARDLVAASRHGLDVITGPLVIAFVALPLRGPSGHQSKSNRAAPWPLTIGPGRTQQ
jgi:hypothetical protein